jgi:chromosome partitioning protein
MRVAVWNGKGGVGKTTTALGLAAERAKTGPVSVIDLDPGGHATRWICGSKPPGPSSLDLLCGRSTVADATVRSPQRSGLGLVPAEPALAKVAAELADDPAPQFALAQALEGVGGDFVFDCPAAFGELAIMALCAADVHVCTLRAAALDLDALATTIERCDAIRKRLNPGLRLAAFVICAFDARTSVAAAVRSRLVDDFPGVAVVPIPSAVTVSMAPGAHELLDVYAPSSPATYAYRELARIIEEFP